MHRTLVLLLSILLAAPAATAGLPHPFPPAPGGPAASVPVLGRMNALPQTEASVTVERVEITDVSGPKRMYHGWGHEFTVEIDLRGRAARPGSWYVEWWEYVSYDESNWHTHAIHPDPGIRENEWQDHRIVNPRSRMWRMAAVETRGDLHTVRIVDRPTIPLGNLRIRPGSGREYANLARKLLIEIRVTSGTGPTRVQKSAYVLQILRERAGKPVGALIACGASRPHWFLGNGADVALRVEPRR
jgi:hypothetical protein